MSRLPMGTAALGQNPIEPLSKRFREGLVNQGVAAELIAARWKLDRETLDEYSARSHQRAAAVTAARGFENEVVAITVDGRVHSSDETLRANTTAEGLSRLKRSFTDDALAARFPDIAWSITAGNSSPLTDGASGVRLLATLVNHLEATGQRYGLQTMCEGGGLATAMIIERI